MKRRAFVASGLALFIGTFAAGAQQAGRSFRVFVIYGGPLEQELIVRVMKALEPMRSRLYGLVWLALVATIGAELAVLFTLF